MTLEYKLQCVLRAIRLILDFDRPCQATTNKVEIAKRMAAYGLSRVLASGERLRGMLADGERL